MTHPLICIIILNWNGLADTQECLQSVHDVAYPGRQVILVDNASSGDDVQQLSQEFGGWTRIIRNPKNYGFALANNLAIQDALQHSSPDYVFLLNNDTVVAPDCLDAMIKAAESHPRAGILGPKIYYYDCDGRKDVIWSAGGQIRWWHPWVYAAIGHNEDDMPKYQTLRTVHWISGAAIMIKRAVLDQMPGLNTDYYFGTEDVEYCLKARARGFECLYVPTARIWHKVGRSRTRRGPGFADLPDYYRFLRGNFPSSVRAYHLLISPILLMHRAAFWLRGKAGPHLR